MSQIVLDRAPPPKEPAPLKISGSPITAAANTVAVKTAEQAQAVNALGGRMTGGATVEVHNIPMTPSAGGSNHANVFASIMGAKAQLAEQSQYDKLGNAPAMTVGGKRTHRKHNARRVAHRTRKHRGSARKSRGVRRARGRVHTRRR